MASIDPFKPLIEQIQSMIKEIREEQGKSRISKIPKSTADRVKEVEQLVAKFKAITDGLNQSSPQEPAPTQSDSASKTKTPLPEALSMSDEEKEFFRKLSRLEDEAEAGRRYFDGVIQQERMRMQLLGQQTKKGVTKRKKKFRGMDGTGKGWMSV
jgi:5'-deoxynucleotidase YfbR-like HD superfamily hydrolase